MGWDAGAPTGVGPGTQGAAGQPGESAYQLWLDAGHSGTLDDFLASLVGQAGPEGPAGTGSGAAATLRGGQPASARPLTAGFPAYSAMKGDLASSSPSLTFAQLSRMKHYFPNGLGVAEVVIPNFGALGTQFDRTCDPSNATASPTPDDADVECVLEMSDGRLIRVHFPDGVRQRVRAGASVKGYAAVNLAPGDFLWSRLWAACSSGASRSGFVVFGPIRTATGPGGYTDESVVWADGLTPTSATGAQLFATGKLTGGNQNKFALWPIIRAVDVPDTSPWMSAAIIGDSTAADHASWAGQRLGAWPPTAKNAVAPHINVGRSTEKGSQFLTIYGELRRQLLHTYELGITVYGTNDLDHAGLNSTATPPASAPLSLAAMLAVQRKLWALHRQAGAKRLFAPTLPPPTKLKLTGFDPTSHTTDTPTTWTVTLTAATDVITKTAHGLSVGDFIVPTATGGGLSANTVYWVSEVPSSSTLKVSATRGGPSLDLTADVGSLAVIPSQDTYWNTPANQAIQEWDPVNATWTNTRGFNEPTRLAYNAYLRTAVLDTAVGLPYLAGEGVHVVDVCAAMAVQVNDPWSMYGVSYPTREVWGLYSVGGALTASVGAAMTADLLHPDVRTGAALAGFVIPDSALRY